MTKRTTFIVGTLLLILLGFLVYKNLGGGQAVNYSREIQTFIILGEPYEGDYNSNRLEGIFIRARVQAEELGGKLAVVNYGSDTEARQISQFIGVILEDSTSLKDPNSYEMRKFRPEYCVKATILSHNFVMPKPAQVREGAIKFNADNEANLSQISIEVYESERELNVFFLSE